MKKTGFKPEHFAKLTQYNLQGLPKQSYHAARYEAGEEITRTGRDMGCLALVLSGTAKVYRTAPNGKNLILCYYLSDGVLGEIELMTRQALATTTTTAVTAFECVLINRRACEAELKTNILFSNQLALALAQKLDQSAENYMFSALCTAQERLCRYILNNTPGDTFSEVLTDVAGSLGTSYRHLLRMLSRLCGEKILQKTERGFLIIDGKELAKRAQGMVRCTRP